MQTRRDQLQAYRYLVRRVLASLLGSDPEAIEQPMRRVSTSTFAGIMVGVVACAGVALYGWLADTNSTKWKNEANALIVVKETNAAYLYLSKTQLAASGQQNPQQPQVPGQTSPEKDMVLVPVRNYTSARLILKGEPKVVRVARHSLDGIPRGPEIGIPLAPNSLPSKENVTSTPWTICSTARTVDDATRLEVDLLIGTPEATVKGTPVGDQALLVSAPNKAIYLVWKGKRLKVHPGDLPSLQMSASAATPVGNAWLAALEEGQPLRAPIIPNRKTRSQVSVGGQATTIGQVFHTPSPDSYYVMLNDGLTRISQVQAFLLLGSGTALENGRVQSSPTEVAIGIANRATSPSTPSLTVRDLPDATPKLVDLGGTTSAPVCLWLKDGQDALTVTTGGKLPDTVTSTDAGATGEGTPASTGVAADRVVVQPGKVAVVGLVPAPGVKPEGYYLITEDGVKFPVPNTETLGWLGYGGADPVQVPSTLLRLIPQGPALTEQSAYRSAPFNPTSPGSGG
ncbi:type VII secretion protein EccB [Actinopolymorpha alba]|uniref:type VII secretion protein EccB n=1 Tax=Actinopolymorpha alba TaxID=533267 RepID=UPI00036173B4|nr:type VII secretion protein EccB [Actinopolymorpha alba]